MAYQDYIIIEAVEEYGEAAYNVVVVTEANKWTAIKRSCDGRVYASVQEAEQACARMGQAKAREEDLRRWQNRHYNGY